MGNEIATGTTSSNGTRHAGLDAQNAIVEPRPTHSGGGEDELFLTPRVLDAGAFARYADTLRGIIAQASAQGRTLEDFSADAEAMIKRCDDASETVNKRLQSGIRMLKMIDERAARTDALLEKVQRALPDAQAMSDQIDRVIDERLKASETRINALITQAEGRAQVAEERAIVAIERSQKQANELELLGQSIDDRLASLHEAIEQSVSERGLGVDAIRTQVDEARAQINDTIAKAFDKANEASEALSSRADATMGEMETRVERVGQSIEPLIEASSKAMRALGMDPEHPVFEDSPLARIESLVDRGETQLASLDGVYRQLEDLQSQAERVRSAFGSWLTDAAEQLDTLEARKGQIVGPMQEAADSIRELGPDLETKLRLASTELSHLQLEQKTLRETIAASSQLANEVTDRMGNQSGQLQALLDGSLHKLSTRVEQAGVWLGTLIQRAESLGASMPGAGSMGFEADAPVAVTQPPEVQAPEPTTPYHHEAEVKPVAHEFRTDASMADPVEKNDVPEAHEADQEPHSFVVPRPPQLPLDAISFDGAEAVIEHHEEREGA
ncbi:MAG: hypothetical protein CMJ35_15765 [Phycisphaerae bacterium]|nr:hypothetical protein [Phycisphaerae bacterium]MBM93044.1 hypothetical protein [Phycisphaerae bacterium]HCT44769.1 hypothetical protein [Phycisphaerales bacterium]